MSANFGRRRPVLPRMSSREDGEPPGGRMTTMRRMSGGKEFVVVTTVSSYEACRCGLRELAETRGARWTIPGMAA